MTTEEESSVNLSLGESHDPINNNNTCETKFPRDNIPGNNTHTSNGSAKHGDDIWWDQEEIPETSEKTNCGEQPLEESYDCDDLPIGFQFCQIKDDEASPDDGFDSDVSFDCGGDDHSDGGSVDSDDDYDDDELKQDLFEPGIDEVDRGDEIDGAAGSSFSWIEEGAIEPKLADILQWDLLPLLEHSQLAPVVKELIERELTFIEQILEFQKFRNTCLAEKLITEAEAKSVFPNLDSILKCHLYIKMRIGNEIQKNPAAPSIGKAFQKPAPFLKIHQDMIHACEHSQNTIKTWSDRDPRIATILNEHSTSKIPLWNKIVEPFKILGDLKMLFSRYIEQGIQKNSPDRKLAEQTRRSIDLVLKQINDLKRFYELCDRMVELRPLFRKKNIEIMKEHRHLVLEDTVNVMNPKRGTMSSEEAYLFNDVLILCKPTLSDPWSSMSSMSSMTIVALKDTHVKGEGSRVIIHNKRKVVEIQPKQPFKELWLSSLTENCRPPRTDIKTLDGQRAPRLASARTAKECIVCKRNLQSTRGNHCHCCGQISCGECRSKRAILRYDPQKQKRVCQLCYRRLTVKSM